MITKGKAKQLITAMALSGCCGSAIRASADVLNGNFSSGNTGFTSGYTNYSPAEPQSSGGNYTVGSNPNTFNYLGASFGDHTTGSGLMLIADGATTSGVQAWSETISVTPNTEYAFSYYTAPWGQLSGDGIDPSPASLSATAGGSQIGSTLNLSSTDGAWTQFTADFNSGSQTTTTLAITDLNTVLAGNDFTLDDVSVTAVPEPSTPMLALCGATFLLLRRRRRCA